VQQANKGKKWRKNSKTGHHSNLT